MSSLAVGIDQAWDRASPAQLREFGAAFVCRYLGEDTTGKNLTRAEADAYRAAGIAIVSNYEYAAGGALRGFRDGQRVARLAADQHLAVGGPADRPIYFSVDLDVVTGAQMSAVGSYFGGIASVIGHRRVGAYGEYSVIKMLFDNALIAYGWQTYAWSSGNWDPRAQLRQVRNGIKVAGHTVDLNEAWAADYGQWGVVDNVDERLLRGWNPTITADGGENGRGAGVLLADGWRYMVDGVGAYTPGRASVEGTSNGWYLDGLLKSIRDYAAAAAERPQAAVDATDLAEALLANPKFVEALREALGGLRLEVAAPPF